MKTVFKTLAVQVLLAAVAVWGYMAYDFDVAVHQGMLIGRCAKTIFFPRGKTAESDRHVVATGRARLASLVLGNWMHVGDLELVHEVVAGPEWYRAVYVDPETGELKKYTTQVQWLDLAERYPAPKGPMAGDELLEDVGAGTTVVTDNRDYNNEVEVGS